LKLVIVKILYAINNIVIVFLKPSWYCHIEWHIF